MFTIISPCYRNLLFRRICWVNARKYADEQDTVPPPVKKGLVVGAYFDADSHEYRLSNSAQKINNLIGGKLEELVKEGTSITLGKAKLFENVESEFQAIAVSGFGKNDLGYNPIENLDEGRENVRIAAANGVLKLRDESIEHIYVDGMGFPEAAAEGAGLAAWRYQEFKSKEHHKILPELHYYSDEDKDDWQRGLFKAEAQNIARRLSDMPSNLLTPTAFAQYAAEALCPCGCSVEVRNRDWMESKHMNAFLTVARGSCEPPIVLEINYSGGGDEENSVVLVGSGITFSSGGLCLLPCAGMRENRGNMAGAAVIVAVMRAVAALSIPLNVHAVIPLCENMVSGMAVKPGDVIASMSGKSILVEDTSFEARIVLADALFYASTVLKPKFLIDIAVLIEGMKWSLGSAASGVFCSSDELWDDLEKAGSVTGDRVWRFPLWKHFTENVTQIEGADTTNVGWGSGGNSCKAAAFLRQFVSTGPWIHVDITSAGRVAHTDQVPYLHRGRMTGRPARTIVHFIYQLARTPK